MLKFLLIFLIVIYLLGYLGRIFINNWLRKMSNQARENHSNHNQKEGDVTINMQKGSSKKINKNDGDYIDYEEVE